MWLLAGGWLGWGVGALVLVFFGVQTRFARRNRATFEESFGIRAENQALAQSLEFERAQLAIARDQAVSANNDKSRFLAGASHDLRQPLQAMALNVGALRHVAMAPDAQPPREQARHDGRDVGRGGKHVGHLEERACDERWVRAWARVLRRS